MKDELRHLKTDCALVVTGMGNDLKKKILPMVQKLEAQLKASQEREKILGQGLKRLANTDIPSTSNHEVGVFIEKTLSKAQEQILAALAKTTEQQDQS